MLGKLNSQQSQYILMTNHIGRIGCCAEGKVLVVPITYVFDGNNIYAQSLEGEKITMMRKAPQVCFEVDSIDNLANWRSVIVQGKFEELKTPTSQSKARKLLLERLLPLPLGDTVNPSREFADPPHQVQKKQKPVVYRIVIEEISGRYEKQIIT